MPEVTYIRLGEWVFPIASLQFHIHEDSGDVALYEVGSDAPFKTYTGAQAELIRAWLAARTEDLIFDD